MESLSSDSPASLSPTRANALARRMSVTCSATLFESLLNLDPRLSSVKTSPDSLHLQPSEATSLERTWVSRQISLFAPLQSETFFESWPKAGLMLGGEVWAQKTWERHTVGNASGVSHGAALAWPTPRHSENVQDELTMRRVAESQSGSGWPAGVEEGRGATLSTAVAANERNWPSPNAFDSVDDFGKRRESNREDGQGMHSVSLRHMVDEMVQWATPIDSDYKGSVSLESAEARALVSSRGTRLPEQITLVEGESARKLHRLNPDWEELLMTWPIGWTDPTKPCAGIWPGHAAGQGTFQYPYEPPRTVHRDHCPNRTKRVSAIGNGVCTATAELAYYLLLTEPVR